MNVVLFLGAGFSAHFGQPTMNQFLYYALERLNDSEKNFLLKIVLEARAANSMVESSPTNLEDMLSLVVMGDRLGLYNEEPRSPQLKKILQKIYSYLDHDQVESFWNRSDDFRSFLGVSDTKKINDLSIITTNYDLNIECALYKSAKVKLPFEARHHNDNINLVDRLYSEQGVPLYKLHGSVNWFDFEQIEEDASKPIKKIDVVDGVIEIGASRTRMPYVLTGEFLPHTRKLPIIVPPSFLKPQIEDDMLKNWAGAAESLNKAELVVFVGYSFPPTDVEMKYFLARSIADNPILKQVLVIDTYAEDIVERLKGDNSGFGSHFKSFLRPIQVKNTWREVGNILQYPDNWTIGEPVAARKRRVIRR